MSHWYPIINECIYCGRTEPPLELEHIIPLAFGGTLLLPKSSCRACAKIINQQIETPVLSHEWGAFRSKRKFPTRNKKKRKKQMAIRGVDGTNLSIPIEHHSTPVPLYRFKEARILSGSPRGNDNHHFTASMLSSTEEEMAMQRRFPTWNQTHQILMQPDRFARLLAKIAHGFAIAELGFGTFTPLNQDLILGRSNDYSFTVGGDWEIPPPVSGANHDLKIEILFASTTLARIIVQIRLFPAAETPQYHVVTGEIDLENPLQAASFEKHRADGKLI